MPAARQGRGPTPSWGRSWGISTSDNERYRSLIFQGTGGLCYSLAVRRSGVQSSLTTNPARSRTSLHRATCSGGIHSCRSYGRSRPSPCRLEIHRGL